MLTSPSPSAVKQQGVAIIEAMIAILIFSIGVLGIVGMQANMVKNTSESQYRAEAAFIAQQRIGLMWADPDNLTNYLQAGTPLDELPGGQLTITQPSVGQFIVTVGWTAPGKTAAADDTTAPCFMAVSHCFTTTVSITGG